MSVVAFTGSRGWTNRAIIRALIERLPAETVVVVGDAHGADAIVREEAEAVGLFVARVDAKPHWPRYGKRAGMMRNAAMLRLGVEFVVAFWDAHSPGTAGMIRLACHRGIPTTVYYPNGTHAAANPVTPI